MTITATDLTAGPFTATGSPQTLPFDFMVITPEEVEVYQLLGLVETTIDPSEYGVTVNLTVDGLAAEGGSITGLTADATYGDLYVRAVPADEQEQQWSDYGSRLGNLNEALDRSVLRHLSLKQQLMVFLTTDPTATAISAAAQSQADRILAQAAREAADADALATAADALAAGDSEAAAAISAAAAATSAAAAGLAAIAARYYPGAQTYAPRGATGTSGLVAGSGGTNGTFAFGTTGGNFLVNPTGTFTVAGGVLTAVTVLTKGLYLGAAPTAPTVTFAASAGLGGGAAVTLTVGHLVAVDGTYYTDSLTDLSLLQLYRDDGSNTPVIVTGGTAVKNLSAVLTRLDDLERRVQLPKICFLCDSFGQNGFVVSATGALLYENAQGMAQTAYAMDPRWNNDTYIDVARGNPYINGAGQGISGQTLVDFWSRRGSIAAQNPDIVFIQPPINSIRSAPTVNDGGVYVAALLALMDDLISYFTDRGIFVITGSITPQTVTQLANDYRRQVQVDYNTGIVPLLSGRALTDYVDFYTPMADVTSIYLGKEPLAGLTFDGLHPTPQAQYRYLAPAFLATLKRRIVPQTVRPPTYNLFPNWNQLGSAGVATFSISGSVATGFKARPNIVGETTTVVMSLVANAETGGQKQRAVATLAGANANTYVEHRLNPGDTIDVTALAGRWIRFSASIYMKGDAFRGVELNIANRLAAQRRRDLTTDSMGPGIDGTFILRTPKFYLDGSITALDPSIWVNLNPTGGGPSPTWDINWWGLEVVDDPRVVRFQT